MGDVESAFTELETEDFENPQGPRISERTMERMRAYSRALDALAKEGVSVVASKEIAERVGVKPGLVRKDLSHFGGFGRPSVGYNVAYLQRKILDILRVSEVNSVAWVGARRLMDDPSLIDQLALNKCRIAVVFDDQAGARIGKRVVPGLDRIEDTVRKLDIKTAVIALPGKYAQGVAKSLVAGGVKAILNLSAVMLTVPPDVKVRSVDIAGELMLLSYYSGETSHKKEK
ncbi:MAG TPA: redox-sensing transcriptional repressor Rex [Armatimonadota bacterium]